MERKIICFLILFVSLSIYSQEVLKGERNGLLKATASFYPSKYINSNLKQDYLGGNAEYFFHDKFSFRGDVFQSLNDVQNTSFSMLGATKLTFGFNKHFSKGKWSPFVGIYTGVSRLIEKSTLPSFAEIPPQVELLPVSGLMVGTQFYFYKYFHFYIETRYTHQMNPFREGKLDDISFTAGLGFQLSTRKH